MLNFLLGADPELFVKRKDTGELASAHGLVVGDKKNPTPVPFGAVQVDGMALEFNIDPTKEGEFSHHINAVMETLAKMCPEYDLIAEPVAEFGRELIDAQPEEAKILGCEPDFCAWTDGEANVPPNVDAPFRTGAGHVHIGWCEDVDNKHWEHIEACHMVCKQLDFLVASAALFFDTDTKRRELYGCAGAYRPKSYGVEYRTLSNFWLSEQRYIDWIEKAVRHALRLLERDSKAYIHFAHRQRVIREMVNGDEKRCDWMIAEILDFYEMPLPAGWVIQYKWGDPATLVDELAEERVVERREFGAVIGWDDAPELLELPLDDPQGQPIPYDVALAQHGINVHNKRKGE